MRGWETKVAPGVDSLLLFFSGSLTNIELPTEAWMSRFTLLLFACR